MISWSGILEALVIATAVSYAITPLVRKIALKTGYVDHPKSNKVHAHPTALLGGAAIYAAFVIALFMTTRIGSDPKLASMVIATTFLLGVGLVDDRMGMMPEIKLLGQFLAAMLVIKAGLRMEFLHNYYLNVIVTYIWIVGITNAFNLLDNMNGLSAGIASIAAVFFGIIMWSSGQVTAALVSFALAGATAGFLRHNFPKANIFMGDSGSLVIGFVLATAAIMGSWSTRFLTTSVAMPIVILAYPIFDTTLVTIMRIREGRSIFQGGKDHSSHRLALLGLKKKRAVLVIYGVCVALGMSAVVIQQLSLRAALAVLALDVAGMVALGIRLAMVDTGRYGRSKGRRGDD